MKKREFEERLRAILSPCLPEEDVRKSLEFFDETLADRLEAGMKEEEAVAEIGTPEAVAENILAEVPMATLIKGKIKPRRKMRTWEIVLLVLGSPLWLAILVIVAALIFTVYALIWTVVAVLWAVAIAFIVGAPAGIFGGIWEVYTGSNQPLGIFIIGAGICSAGLAILTVMLAIEATVWTAKLGKALWVGLKKLVAGKEQA